MSSVPTPLTSDEQALSYIQGICAQYAQYHKIDPSVYERYGVKRGLRNADGTGVMAGITQIGNVQGYYIEDGEKVPMDGQLIYRGMRRRPTCCCSAPCPPRGSCPASGTCWPTSAACPPTSPRT